MLPQFSKCIIIFLAVFAAVALSGRLFIQETAAAGEPVKIIVYARDVPVPVLSVRGIAAASQAKITAESVLDSIPQTGLIKEHRFSSLDGFTATVSRSYYEQLKSNPNLEVFEDHRFHVVLDDSGPLIGANNVPGLIYNGSNVTGSGISVCIIDTGINYSHPALGGCSQASFLAGTCAKVPGGYDYVNSDSDPADDNGHGTHVAGIVASTDSTYRGIAPNASIVAMKVLDSSGAGYGSDIISAIDWCVTNAARFNISAISMSLGGDALFTTYCDSDSTESASAFAAPIDDAVAHNISVVIASGNDASTTGISSPACIKNATSVGATTKADAIASYSNRNNITDLLAPGSLITSLRWSPTSCISACTCSGIYMTCSGTSMATPHVAGAIALLAQYNKLTTALNISPQQAFLALNTTGKNITDNGAGGSGIKFARINVYDALFYLDTAAPIISFVPPTLANNSNSSSVNIFVNVTSSEVLQNASLEWNNGTHITNYSMAGSALNWFINHTSGSIVVNVTYRVWGNDSSGRWGVSENRTVSIVNSAPRIDSLLPSTYNVSINEPNNQTFNITYTDYQNDTVTVDWYVNGTLQESATNTNFTFIGNYSQASQQLNGSYNITAILSDGSLSTMLNWTLTINNTNRAPEWVSIANQTFVEGIWFNFTIAAADLDNDSITYFINNTANFTINSTNGNISSNFSEAGNFSGVFYLAVNASDGLANISSVIIINITWLNDTSPPAAPASINVSALPGGNVMVNWTGIPNEAGVTYIVYRSLLNITTFGNNLSNYSMNVTNITAAARLAEGVQTFIDNTSLNNTVYFYAVAAVDSKGNLQNITGGINLSNSYNVTVNDTVIPQSTGNLTLSTSDTSVTLRWLNVTQDVQGDSDFYNLTYYVYISALNNANVDLSPGINVSGANLSLTKSVPGSTNFTTIAGLSAGLYHFAVTTRDDGGNENITLSIGRNYGNITVTPTVANPNSGNGGSSGGGGGGAASPSSSSKAAQLFSFVADGETAVMKISRQDISFTSVTFTAAAPLSNVNVVVERLNESKVLDRPSLDVYEYVSVTTKLAASNISQAQVQFKVPGSWLAEHGFSPQDVVLMRYFASSWGRMKTAAAGSDGSYYYYSADLPGFSVFAITAEKAIRKPVSAINETKALPLPASPANESVQALAPQVPPAKGLTAGLRIAFIVAALAAIALALIYNQRRVKSP